jgi:hypothetical protein
MIQLLNGRSNSKFYPVELIRRGEILTHLKEKQKKPAFAGLSVLALSDDRRFAVRRFASTASGAQQSKNCSGRDQKLLHGKAP